MKYNDLYGTATGALCADHKRLLDRIDPLIIEAYRNEDNDAIDALNLEIRTKLSELLDHVRRTSGLEHLTPHADYGFLECAPPADELRDEIRAKIETHEANLAELDAYIAECFAHPNANNPDFDREGAEELVRRCREMILAHHEAKIAELEAKKAELYERYERAGEALNAEIQRKQAYIFEILEAGNPDGVTIEQIDAEYDPRIAELNRAYGDAMRAIVIFNGYRDEFPDEA